MKKNILVLLVLMFCMILMSACGGTATADNQQPAPDQNIAENTINVTLEIIFPEDAAMDNISEEVVLPEESNVENLTSQYCQDKKLVCNVRQSTGYRYFDNICGVSAGDFGGNTGWIFEVNGEMTMDGANLHVLADGDTVCWKFVNYNDITM